MAYAPNATEGLLGKLVGSGKTSIRASYGLFYSAIEGATAFVQNGSAPFGLYYSAPAPTLLASPYIDRATGHNEGIKFPFIPPPANVSPENPDTSFDWAAVLPISGSPVPYPHNVVPYMQQFALSLQLSLIHISDFGVARATIRYASTLRYKRHKLHYLAIKDTSSIT